jgi:pyrophosphatase PpaX
VDPLKGALPPAADRTETQGPSARRIGAVLFDLDGTLIDSAELIMTAFEATVQANLHQTIDRTEILGMWSRPIRERFRALAPDQDEMLAQDYLRRYLALHDRYARLFPGVGDVLETLRRRGYAMGIVTSKRRATAQAAVSGFHLDRWCTVVIADEDVDRHKPDPEPVQLAAARLGISAAETLMVGDSPLDIAAGHRAGAATAAALWGTVEASTLLAEAPDHRLTRPEDLLPICPSGTDRSR